MLLDLSQRPTACQFYAQASKKHAEYYDNKIAIEKLQ